MTEITVKDYDFTEVIGNLQKARRILDCLPRGIRQEVTDVRTVEVIGTLLVARKRERVFFIQTLALEYGVCRKAILSIYLRLYLLSYPSIESIEFAVFT